MPRLTNGLEQVLTNLGIVGSGYKLFFFETGTTTLKTTYSDEDLTVANTNPIVLNSAGRPNVNVWGSDPSLYRMILGTPDSVVGNITTVVDVDPIDNYQINNIAALNPIPTAYWGMTTGTSTAYILENPLVDISSYSNTQTFFIDFNIACGASPTLKIKDLDAITLKKYKGDGTTTDLVADDLQIQRYLCINDGTNIVVLNPKYPENLDATFTTKGVSYLNKKITISNNAIDPNNDIDFSDGNFDFADGSGQALATAMTKRIDATWAAGTNQGGLDTGSKAANTPYYCFSVHNPTSGLSDFLFSSSRTPDMTLPNAAGYTILGEYLYALMTDGSSNIRGANWVCGEGVYDCFYNIPILDVSLTDPSVGQNSVNITIPIGSKIFCHGVGMAYGLTGGSGGGFISINFGSPDDDLTALVADDTCDLTAQGETNRYARLYKKFATDTRQLKYNIIASSISTRNFKFKTLGWQEYL